MISLIQHFEADFLWKVSLKFLNSGKILKTFTHVYVTYSALIHQPDGRATSVVSLKFQHAETYIREAFLHHCFI